MLMFRKHSMRRLNPFLIILFVGLFAAAGLYWLLQSSAATRVVPVSSKMVGLNGTYGMDVYADDAKNLNARWLRVEQWGDKATYDAVPTTLDRLSARGLRMLPLVNNYSVGWRSATDKTTWVN